MEGDRHTKRFAIYEICRRERRVPYAHKRSTTTDSFVQKETTSFRPIRIPISPAEYKVSVRCGLGKETGRLGDGGGCDLWFVPGEGCLEHSLDRSMLKDTRRRQMSLHLVWLELRKAFGSVPHRFLLFSMQSLGVPEGIYADSTFDVQLKTERDEIPQVLGVKRGCVPISCST